MSRDSAYATDNSLAKIRRGDRRYGYPPGKHQGGLRQGVSDRLTQGFTEIRSSVEAQLAGGRREQTQDLRQAREELTNSLAPDDLTTESRI